MITIDAPISFLTGAAIAATCAQDGVVLRRDQTFARGLIVQALVLCPLIVYFMVRFPDWEWNYFFDARRFFFDSPGPVGEIVFALSIVAINGSFVLGFGIAERWITQGNERAVWKMLAVIGGLILAIMGILYDQSLHLGTYAQWKAAQAPLILTIGEFYAAMGVATIGLAAGLTWVVRGAHRPA
ncbi:MAG: hypothetical protein D6761_05505 [Candidatus Dadabacteria bacterium]|nr:MAG: hypothetical protein D6761_05505 [Candidatus Dadabacteria bacterium]